MIWNGFFYGVRHARVFRAIGLKPNYRLKLLLLIIVALNCGIEKHLRLLFFLLSFILRYHCVVTSLTVARIALLLLHFASTSTFLLLPWTA